MSSAQIIRTVAIALIAGGGALGSVPNRSCGAGWWMPPPDGPYHGLYGLGGRSDMAIATCETAMAPVGSWALALVMAGAILLVGRRFDTWYRLKNEAKK